MTTEYKNAPVSGVMVEDEGDGIISALVSVTGIVDNVKDIIEPGAYKRTLGVRRPKGIWHHTWTDPIAKTLHAEELMPGDKRLPATLPDGRPWPKEAGALLIKMQFNLATDRGKRAYEDVKFFGNEQEWSIGYNVPTGGARKDAKTGIRRISDIDLFEYSPVLFGAMPHARTMEGVKVAQLAFKDAMGIDYSDLSVRIEEWEQMSRKDDGSVMSHEGEGEDFVGDGSDGAEGDGDEGAPDFDEIDALADDFDDEDESVKAISPTKLRKAIDALTDLLDDIEDGDDSEPPSEDNTDEKSMPAAYLEAKAMEYLTLAEAVDGYPFKLDSTKERLLSASAAVFDDAVKVGNVGAMERAASSVMDVIEGIDAEAEEDEDDIKRDALAVVTQVMSDVFSKVSELKADDGVRFTHEAQEFVMVQTKSRQIGWPVLVDGGTISRKSRQRAFLDSLDDDKLIAVADYLEGVSHERGMKRLVGDLLDGRRASETKRQYDSGQMAKMGGMGHAFKNGNGEWSYPIHDTEDLGNAIQAYGRCMPGDKERLKSYIMKRAEELGAEDRIPASWNEKSVTIDLEAFKSWGGKLDLSSK